MSEQRQASALIEGHHPSSGSAAASGKHAVIFLFSSAAVIIFLLFSRLIYQPLWYDESNYLILAKAIRATGYPIWFWAPDRPQLFLTSPPGVLYFIGLLPAGLRDNLALIRLLFTTLFGLFPIFMIYWYRHYLRKSVFSVFVTLGFAVSSGFYFMEFVQVRLDLPLACLSTLVLLIFAARADDAGTLIRQKTSWLLYFAALLVFSSFSFLVKFQAICLTLAVFFEAAWIYIWRGRKGVDWAAISVHVAGIGTAVIAVIWWVWVSPYASPISVLKNLHWNLSDRIAPHDNLLNEAAQFARVCHGILAKTALPMVTLLIATAMSKAPWGNKLFRLSLALAVAVIFFNVMVYRLVGAGEYYMVMAAIPLGYVLGCSLEALLGRNRSAASLLAVALLLGVHAGLNMPSVTRAFHPDIASTVANYIAPAIRPDELVLLDDEHQDRAVPLLLGRVDHYGFLFYMEPAQAGMALQNNGTGRVGALILRPEAFDALKSEKWHEVRELIEHNFSCSTRIRMLTNLIVLLRRDSAAEATQDACTGNA